MARPVLFVATLTSLLTAQLACGPLPLDFEVAAGNSEQAIINGESCDASELETAVAILVDAELDFLGSIEQIKTVTCTGTLIAPDTVLAEAHCFDASLLGMGFATVLREDYFVTFHSDLVALAEGGTSNFPADTIAGRKWVPHPDFDIDSMGNVNGPGDYKDIAVMFLEQAVDHVQPEFLISTEEAEQIVEQATVQIAGWGQQINHTNPWEPLPPGTVGSKQCATSFINELALWEMQIGSGEQTSRKCHGDSGGPTYFDVETSYEDKRRLIGVTSHSYDREDCLKGGVDTRVDYWLDWIDGQMQVACDDGTRVWCEERGIVTPAFYQRRNSSDAGVDDPHEAGACLCAARPSAVGSSNEVLLLTCAALAFLYRRRK